MKTEEAKLLLGLPLYHCSVDRIRQAYHQQCLKVHPDRGGNTKDFTKIRQAYKVLLEEATPKDKTTCVSPKNNPRAKYIWKTRTYQTFDGNILIEGVCQRCLGSGLTDTNFCSNCIGQGYKFACIVPLNRLTPNYHNIWMASPMYSLSLNATTNTTTNTTTNATTRFRSSTLPFSNFSFF